MLDSARFQFLERPVKIDDESPGAEASELVAGMGASALRVLLRAVRRLSAFSAATEVAPAYAAAHAGLALTKVAQATAHDVPHLEALAEAKTIALRALALDDKSADAQVALGQVMLFSEWDWTAAERLPAGACSTRITRKRTHYGGLMERLGQLTRGFELKLQGLECDSTSALAHVLIAVSLWNQRRTMT